MIEAKRRQLKHLIEAEIRQRKHLIEAEICRIVLRL